MALEVTTEVVNESDCEVVLKRVSSGIFGILKKLTERGERFTIKTDSNATFKEYKLVVTSASTVSSYLVTSDDCLENERLVIKKDRAGRLRLDMIRRGMSVTEVVNDISHDFEVKNGEKLVGVLKAGGEYLIQRDPTGKSESQHYSLVEGEKPPIVIPTEYLVNNQRLTVSGEDNPAVTSKISRAMYLTEVFNKTKTNLKLRWGSEPSEMVTLEEDGRQSFTIEYDPCTKNEYWVQAMAEPLKEIRIPPAYFVQGRRIDIIPHSDCFVGVKLESAEPRPVPIPGPKRSILSLITEAFGV